MEIPLKPPLILALSTSGKTGGIALLKDDLLWEINFFAKESYSKGIFKGLAFLIENLGKELSQIDYIAVDIGPGSFTGLRIGLSIVKALDLIFEPLFIPLSSLEILAWNYPQSPYPVLSIIDAYSRELFSALYRWREDHFEVLFPPSLIPFERLKELVSEPTLFVSESLPKWEREFEILFGEKFLRPPLPPSLRAGLFSQVGLLKLKKGDTKLLKGEDLLPLYLKASEAERKRCSPTF